MIPRFQTMDKIALVIAALLIAGGLFALAVPQDLVFGRATNYPKNRQETLAEHIPPSQSRLYGLLALLGGAGLATCILWASRSS